MTRVEKYRNYRNEIANKNFETFSKKKETAKQIEKISVNNSEKKLNYDQVMDVYETFGAGEKKLKKRQLIRLTKYEIFYFLIAIIFILIMISALIVVGIKLWR